MKFPDADHNEMNDNSSESRHITVDIDGDTASATPTTTESTLPWKRDEGDGDSDVIQQTEFPSWANNKEYLAYNSPSATFLGRKLSLTRPSVFANDFIFI